MTAITPTAVDVGTGAASHTEIDWHSINWEQVNQTVRRLQTRIVKATHQGRWNKVKALQHLLTHSYSGKALAVRRVTENQGKRTPGVDGELWTTPERKSAAIHALKRRGYRPQPLRRVYIPKKNGRKRPLGIPTLTDRAMQALYLLALEPIAETRADPNSYGFRQARSTTDALAQCFNVLASRTRAQWILEGDITACFDRISHPWLLAHVPMDKTILHKWLKAGFMDQSIFYPTAEGTPQGGIISPVLANIALDGLEKKLREHYPANSTKSRWAKVNFIRYADDFIITGTSKELLEEEVKPLVGAFLQERGLELSPEKTKITHIEDGFDFLGRNVRKYVYGKQRKLLIKPSKQNVHAFLAKVRAIIKANKQLPAGTLILQLNPIIRGWTHYHRHGVSSKAFGYVDSQIFWTLWQWAKRRHPHKASRWIKKKYFTTFGNQHWIFSGEAKERPIYLFQASSVPIQRHVKIDGQANPFDPAWECYFEKRLGVNMAATLTGRRHLLHLWKEQHGVCVICNQPITELTGWHNHHIVRRVDGGSHKATNRVLLHPYCHTQVHNRGLHVEKPRSSRSE